MFGTPEQFYDENALSYDAEFSDSVYWRLYEDITWDNIQRYLVPKSFILDAGGGTGRWALRLARLGHHVVMTDISQEMLHVAKTKIDEAHLHESVEFLKLDICDMKILDSNSFDVAMAQGDPVSYCANAKQAILELARVTKPGGHVIISVDNATALIHRPLSEGKFEEVEEALRTKRRMMRNPQMSVEFSFRAFDAQELRELLEACGLTVIRLIGKIVLPRHLIEPLLDSEENYSQVLELAIRLAEDSYRFGFAGHLEIVGRKSITPPCRTGLAE
ncbi:MAG: class I SAM-dependent DNA methyltransferase [Candidatus Hodarchaeales archaeon]|jgi:ubiquinone/menaquinone biosynthesis C-methylase UbiE